MKHLLVACCVVAASLTAQDLPVAGRPYTVEYDPRPAQVLVRERSVVLVYAFDYWTGRVSSTRARGLLMTYVRLADTTRVRSVVMRREGPVWKAPIEIPANAALLSYYVGGQDSADMNHGLTYTSYIYRPDGQPVRNARFRNIAFLNEAGATIDEQLAEITKEVEAYPDNLVALIPFWMLRFDTARSVVSLRELRADLDSRFEALHEAGGDRDSLTNIKAGILYRFGVRVGPIEPALGRSAFREFDRLIGSLPAERRFRYVREIYDERHPAGQPLAPEVLLLFALVVLVIVGMLLLVRSRQRKRTA